MCPFPFFFLWLQSSFPRSPLKKKNTNCVPSWKHTAVVLLGGKKEMSTWFMCHMISSTIAARTKEKNGLRFGIVLRVALISRHSFCKWKKCVIFFKILGAFITLFVPPCLLLFHPFCLWSRFRGAEGFIVSFCVCLFLSFSLFVILPYSESRARPLSLFPHENFQSDYNKAGEQILMDHIS